MVLVALIAASKGVMNCVASFDHLVGKRELARTRFLWPLVTVTTKRERIVAGGRQTDVVRVRITEAGLQALAKMSK